MPTELVSPLAGASFLGGLSAGGRARAAPAAASSRASGRGRGWRDMGRLLGPVGAGTAFCRVYAAVADGVDRKIGGGVRAEPWASGLANGTPRRAFPTVAALEGTPSVAFRASAL